MLEWLVFSLPQDELRDPQVVKSVEFIASTLDENPNRDWSVGPLGHALHALAIYNKRAFGSRVSVPREHVVRQPSCAAMGPDRMAQVQLGRAVRRALAKLKCICRTIRGP